MNSPMRPSYRSFSHFSRVNLIYTLAVILWGAFVRATGSGAGCGEHWPLCNGEVIPAPRSLQMVIEFVHRGSSGVSLLLVAVSFFWARSISERGSLLRRVTGYSVLAIILEALLGAALVLFKLVEFDQSAARAISISLHLMNTLFLVGTLTSVLYFSRQSSAYTVTDRKVFPKEGLFIASLATFVLLGVTGAITALGDTLFPAANLASGFQQDFSPGAHFLVKLRAFHPVMAVLWIFSVFVWAKRLETAPLMKIRGLLLTMVIVQFLIGFLNWTLMAPNALQLVHLLVADVVFILLWWSGLKWAESGNETGKNRIPA